MTDAQTYPYQLEVRASARKPGMFEWALRKGGKLTQRGDQMYRTEDDARKAGMKAVERNIADASGDR